MERAAQRNGRRLPPKFHVEQLEAENKPDESEDEASTWQKLVKEYRELFIFPVLRRRTIFLMIVWFSNSMIFYGLALNSVTLGGSIYFNFFLGGLVEIPAQGGTILIYHYFGRRIPLAVTLLIAALCCAGAGIIDIAGQAEALNTFIVVLSTTGKFCVTASFAMVYIYRFV